MTVETQWITLTDVELKLLRDIPDEGGELCSGPKYRTAKRLRDKRLLDPVSPEAPGGARYRRTPRGLLAVQQREGDPMTCSCDQLRMWIDEFAVGATETLACYWIYGCDAGYNYCLDCCEAKVAEMKAKNPKADVSVDGGWDTEHDSPPFCEPCGARLSGTLTDYGVDQEMDHFIEYWPKIDHHDSWAQLGEALADLDEEDERWKVVRKMVRAALQERERRAAVLAELAAQPGMTDARTNLLNVLVARARQIFHEPSYRLWNDLQRWHSLPFKVRNPRRGEPKPPIAALEKRLRKEADRFAEILGYRWGARNYIAAPYGTYYWPFVIEIEQYKLWRPVEFCEGEAHGLNRPHDDGNPYPEGSEKNRMWWCGYTSTRREEE